MLSRRASSYGSRISGFDVRRLFDYRSFLPQVWQPAQASHWAALFLQELSLHLLRG